VLSVGNLQSDIARPSWRKVDPEKESDRLSLGWVVLVAMTSCSLRGYFFSDPAMFARLANTLKLSPEAPPPTRLPSYCLYNYNSINTNHRTILTKGAKIGIGQSLKEYPYLFSPRFCFYPLTSHQDLVGGARPLTGSGASASALSESDASQLLQRTPFCQILRQDRQKEGVAAPSNSSRSFSCLHLSCSFAYHERWKTVEYLSARSARSGSLYPPIQSRCTFIFEDGRITCQRWQEFGTCF
jgi:hypothetical protein